MERENRDKALEYLIESYAINDKINRLDGICMVGLHLGQLLYLSGNKEEGRKILQRSHDGFLKLGWKDLAGRARQILVGPGKAEFYKHYPLPCSFLFTLNFFHHSFQDSKAITYDEWLRHFQFYLSFQ